MSFMILLRWALFYLRRKSTDTATKPDMVILDISMPKLRGLEVTHEVKTRYPDIKILILTMHRNKEYLLQALSAKADGYLLKEDTDTLRHW